MFGYLVNRGIYWLRPVRLDEHALLDADEFGTGSIVLVDFLLPLIVALEMPDFKDAVQEKR